MTLLSGSALVIIAAALVGVAIGRYPVLRMNRASIALVAATLLIVIGAISLEDAYRAIDMDTIVLIFAMMILNVNLRLAGFFKIVTGKVVTWARTPRQMLALIMMSSGVLSALFLNDTIVLMLTPLVVEVTLALSLNPVPYLIGLVTSANIGSAATIIGNPQNMLIGTASGIPFATFSSRLTPLALLGLAAAWLVIIIVYRADFPSIRFPPPQIGDVRTFRPLLIKSMIAVALMLAAFVAGAPIPLSALGACSILLITRRLKPERVFRELDWSLLVFFSGLFIVTGAIETSGLTEMLHPLVLLWAHRSTASLTAMSAVLSNLVSNVPAVLLLRPVIRQLPEAHTAWLVLAMATTFAGNLTLLGSVANLIVAESAKARGVHLSFGAYLKAGLPITLITLAMGIAWFALIG